MAPRAAMSVSPAPSLLRSTARPRPRSPAPASTATARPPAAPRRARMSGSTPKALAPTRPMRSQASLPEPPPVPPMRPRPQPMPEAARRWVRSTAPQTTPPSAAAAMPTAALRERRAPRVPVGPGATTSARPETAASNLAVEYLPAALRPSLRAAGSFQQIGRMTRALAWCCSVREPKDDLRNIIARNLRTVGQLGRLEMRALRKLLTGDPVELGLLEVAHARAVGDAAGCVHQHPYFHH